MHRNQIRDLASYIIRTYDLSPFDARKLADELAMNEGPDLPEGDIDHDAEDRRAYAEELNERPRPSQY